MRELVIDCQGVSDISSRISGTITIELEEVDMSFLEDLDASVLVNNHNNEKLLEQMDSDEIMTYLEENYSVEIREIK